MAQTNENQRYVSFTMTIPSGAAISDYAKLYGYSAGHVYVPPGITVGTGTGTSAGYVEWMVKLEDKVGLLRLVAADPAVSALTMAHKEGIYMLPDQLFNYHEFAFIVRSEANGDINQTQAITFTVFVR